MAHGTAQKTDIQSTTQPNHLLVADCRKTQLKYRIRELEADYLENLKHLKKVAKKASQRFVRLNQQHKFKADMTLIDSKLTKGD